MLWGERTAFRGLEGVWAVCGSAGGRSARASASSSARSSPCRQCRCCWRRPSRRPCRRTWGCHARSCGVPRLPKGAACRSGISGGRRRVRGSCAALSPPEAGSPPGARSVAVPGAERSASRVPRLDARTRPPSRPSLRPSRRLPSHRLPSRRQNLRCPLRPRRPLRQRPRPPPLPPATGRWSSPHIDVSAGGARGRSAQRRYARGRGCRSSAAPGASSMGAEIGTGHPRRRRYSATPLWPRRANTSWS